MSRDGSPKFAVFRMIEVTEGVVSQYALIVKTDGAERIASGFIRRSLTNISKFKQRTMIVANHYITRVYDTSEYSECGTNLEC